MRVNAYASVLVCVVTCLRMSVCTLREVYKCRPVLTLLTMRTFVSSLAQAQATDGITAPVACSAVASVDAVGPPTSTVTGCNRES